MECKRMLIISALDSCMVYLLAWWRAEAGPPFKRALTNLKRMLQRYLFKKSTYQFFPINFVFSFQQSKEVKENVAKYIKYIADVLAKIDRQMILIFKTNDLLRNIEFSLGTHNNKTSFVQMTKTCMQVIRAEEMRLCQSKWCYFKTSMKSLLDQLKITCYQIHLWLWWSYFGRLLRGLWA